MKYETYVISLAHELTRRSAITVQLNAQNIKFEFLDAVQFSKKNVNNLNRINILNRPLTSGEIGCFYSHQLIYKAIIDKGTDVALILEDDAILDKNLKKQIEQIINCHLNWDVIILGYSKLYRPSSNLFYCKEPTGKYIYYSESLSIGKVFKNWTCGTVAYLISQKGAKKLTYDNTYITVADDWNFFENNFSLDIYHTRPLLVFEDFTNFSSSIEPDRKDFLPKPQPFLDPLRLIRGLVRKILLNFR